MSDLFMLGAAFIGFLVFAMLVGPVLFRIGERIGSLYGRYVTWITTK